MKLSYLCLLTMFSLSPLVLDAMQKGNPEVYVYNDLQGKAFNIPIKVEYVRSQKPVGHVINAKEKHNLGSLDYLDQGSSIKINGYGQWLSYSIYNQITIQRDDLLKEWEKVKQHDSDPLYIIVYTESLTPRYVLSRKYDNDEPPKEDFPKPIKAEDLNPFREFARIESHGLVDALKGKGGSFENLDPKDRAKVAVPGGLVYGPTTYEDVYRYILGLDKAYTLDDVTRAYRDLSVKWHPDKTTHPDKNYATSVFRLINHAQEVLSEAAKSRRSDIEGGWVHVDETK